MAHGESRDRFTVTSSINLSTVHHPSYQVQRPDRAAMSTSHTVSPMMARRHHTLHPSNLNTSRSNASLASMNTPAHANAQAHKHQTNRSNKTTGGYTTRDETEVDSTAKSPEKKPVVRDPTPPRQLVVSIPNLLLLIL